MNAQNNKYYYSDSSYIAYSEIGQGKNKIFFLHGFGASQTTWDDIKDKFNQNDYKLILIDLKGFGNSSIPRDNKYSIIEQSRIISEFINNSVEDRYFIVGHSYGGGITLLLPLQLAQKPDGLILIDCAAYNLKTPFFINYLKNPISNKLIYFTSPKTRARFALKKIVFVNNCSEKLVRRYATSFGGKHKRYSFIKAAKQILPQNYEEIITSYNSIIIPTLIIWGENDNVLSIEQGKLLNNQIQNSKLEIISSCGHIPHEERPEETFNVILEFIK